MTSFPQSLLPTIEDGLQWMVDSPEFIKDDLPPEASSGTKFLQETGRRVCRGYARARSALGGVAYAPVYSNLCTPYLDSIGEGPTSGGDYGPLYPGGQCAVAYIWTQKFRSYNPDTGLLTQEIINDFPPYGGPLTWTNLPDVIEFGEIRSRVQVVTTNGTLVLTTKVLRQFDQALKATSEYYNIRRADGQPDNCGDQDSTYRPPSFPPNLPPLPPPTNPAPGGGSNWDVNILPDGKVQICIGGECSTSTPPNGGGGPDSGGGPGETDGPPQETDPNDPDSPNEVSGCVEDGNILTGVKIEVTQAPPNYQGLGDIYYKSCWVWTGPSSDLLDMVIDGKTLESGQFVIPDSSDCTCYKVRANPGFKVSVQAYSRPKEE